jgi:LPXTG-site transpeptidase (sortase) family protein
VLLHTALPEDDQAPSTAIQATPTPQTAPAIPTAEPEPVNTSAIARLQVPRIGIDAGVVILGVDPDGTMQSPNNPRDVGWYTFAARPGQLGNIVMAGHPDYANYGPAVFYRLRELQEGDEVLVQLEDGSRFAYRVLSLTAYDANAPVAEAVGPTPNESITLITCAGAFDRSLREYDKRLVVRGERVIGGG